MSRLGIFRGKRGSVQMHDPDLPESGDAEPLEDSADDAQDDEPEEKAIIEPVEEEKVEPEPIQAAAERVGEGEVSSDSERAAVKKLGRPPGSKNKTVNKVVPPQKPPVKMSEVCYHALRRSR